MAIEIEELSSKFDQAGYAPVAGILRILGQYFYRNNVIPYSLNPDIDDPLRTHPRVYDQALKGAFPPTHIRVGLMTRFIRGARRKTIAEIAEEAGMSRNHLQGIELLKSEPTEGKIIKLAKVFDVPVGTLFGE